MSEGDKLGLGLLLSLQAPPGGPYSHQQIYRETIAQAVEAEQLGYRWINVGEHHVTADGFLPAPFAMLAAIAARSSEIGLLTGMLVAPLHHPLAIAEEAAALDLISGGRLTLGLGGGYREEEFAAFGVEFRRRGKIIDETLEILQRAWTGEPFSYDGEVFQIPEVTVAPRPLQRPHPPIWFGGVSKPALRRAARWGAPCFPGGSADFELIAATRARHRELVAEAGTEDRGLFVQRFCLLADTLAEARRLAKPSIDYNLAQYRSWGRPIDDLESWERLDETVIVGDEQHCAELIGRYRELGTTDLIVQVGMPLIDPALARESMQRLQAVVDADD